MTSTMPTATSITTTTPITTTLEGGKSRPLRPCVDVHAARLNVARMTSGSGQRARILSCGQVKLPERQLDLGAALNTTTQQLFQLSPGIVSRLRNNRKLCSNLCSQCYSPPRVYCALERLLSVLSINILEKNELYVIALCVAQCCCRFALRHQ